MDINKAIRVFNSFIDFVNNKIDYVISREGCLPKSYFSDGLEQRMDSLCKLTKGEDILTNIEEIKSVYMDLKDGYEGLVVSGQYR
tara:strand:- start:1589 stop:1843 length:255 start_codon:yes stop_codon:yes gene_type:complete